MSRSSTAVFSSLERCARATFAGSSHGGRRLGRSFNSGEASTRSGSPISKVKPHPFVVANRLMLGSYVSAESALAYFGMIPEHVAQTISVTTGRPGRRQTPLGSFDHRHIAPALFFGFEAAEVAVGQQAFLATPEKALLDLVHLMPGGGSEEHLRGLRLQRRLDTFARRARKPKLVRAAQVIAALAEEEAASASTSPRSGRRSAPEQRLAAVRAPLREAQQRSLGPGPGLLSDPFIPKRKELLLWSPRVAPKGPNGGGGVAGRARPRRG
jgi:hypothetical protein